MLKYFKSIIVSFCVIVSLFVSFSESNAQYLIRGSRIIAYQNDSIILFIDNVRGNTQWQVSKNLSNWQNIVGATRDSLLFHVDSSAYYRAQIAEGTCEMIYSDTILVAQVFDNRDYQFYDAVKIGYQWWMSQNINYAVSNGSWYYDNDSDSYASLYGRLYTWEAALDACPSGWHLPSDDEWKILEIETGMSEAETNLTGWRGSNQGDLLKPGQPLGFDALFGGFKETGDNFVYINSSGTFWSSTSNSVENAWYRGFGPEANIHRDNFNKDMAFSVRCVRDNSPIIEAWILDDSTTKNSAVIEANVIYDGDATIIAGGLCWGSSVNPGLTDNVIPFDFNQGGGAIKITGLVPDHIYHTRAFIANSYDTAFSANITFAAVGKLLLSTGNVTNITTTTSQCGGIITDDGGTNILSRGVCWNTLSNPKVTNFKTSDGTGTGSFTSSVSGLHPNTTYYLRAYAITAYDTVYGNEKEFITQPVSQMATITDNRDGIDYNIIKIGDQWWFAQNLNFDITNSWCYESNTAYCDTLGKLYTWDAALNSCPFGWHVPRDDEFKILERYLGMDSLAAEQTEWRGTNQATQLKEGSPIGFNVTFGGFSPEPDSFVYINSSGTYWTSDETTATEAWYRGFGITDEKIHRDDFEKDMAFSVRCIKTNSPVVIIDSSYNLTKTSVKVDAKVQSDGGVNVTERGVCYSLSTQPTIMNNRTISGSGIGTYTVTLSGLTISTTYYARAYAINNYDTVYSNQFVFVTGVKPIVTTSPVTIFTSTSATFGGNVTDNGGSTVTERGVCYSTTPFPDYADNRLIIGSGSGAFSSALYNLIPNITYYLRAYALNSKGIAYGNEINFKTLPFYTKSTITDTRDFQSYSVIKIGDQRWFAENLNYTVPNSWCLDNTTAYCDTFGRLYSYNAALNACPSHWHLPTDGEWKTLEMTMGMSQAEADLDGLRGSDQVIQLKAEGTSGFDVLLGGYRDLAGIFKELNSSGTFWSSTSVYPETAWYRGFIENTDSIYREGFDKDHGFSVRCLKDTLPLVSTSADILYTDSSFTGGGEVTYSGGTNVTARGICISSTNTNPTILNDSTINGSGTGVFTSYRKGLNPGTTYYVRAYARNSEGFAYGEAISFETSATIPKVSTSAVNTITSTTAEGGGIVTSSGGDDITARGVCYSNTNLMPTILNSHTTEVAGSGAFTSSLSGLTRYTRYYVRAYATNSQGTAYGDTISFRTLAELPVVTITAISDITNNSASGGGNVTSDGGAAVTARGVCWSTTYPPVVTGNHSTDGINTGSFTSLLNGLLQNTRYYVRAYATTSAGTAYSDSLSFRTLADLASVTTGPISGITNNSASGGGNVTNPGASPVSARGLCWSTSFPPTIAGDHSTNGNGTGSYTGSLSVLTRYTKYYVRAYATNSAGTAYGDTVSFRTLDELPILTTAAVSGITINSAVSGGSITDGGGSLIINKGVCWNTTGSPDVSGNKTSDGTGIGAFTSNLTGLISSTTYYIRAYAENSAGTNYGNEISFRTANETGTITDTRDDQEYTTVKIGDDWWMSENLNYRVPGSTYYGDSATYAPVYGRLYTWAAAMDNAASSNADPSGIQGVCPSGWHIPSEAEWNTLISDLGGVSVAGSALKETGITHWVDQNSDATNLTDFTALPSGTIISGISSDNGVIVRYWAATQYDLLNADYVGLSKDNGNATGANTGKTDYNTVRCKKD